MPFDKAINVLIDTLNNDKQQLKEHTKLTLTDIHTLTELCLSKCYCLFEINLHLLRNSGPIGLSLMVSTIRMLFAKNRMSGNNGRLELQNCLPKISPFVDVSHACFPERSHADKFLEIKYTVEFEDHKH